MKKGLFLFLFLFTLLIFMPKAYAGEDAIPEDASSGYLSHIGYLKEDTSFNYLELWNDSHIEEELIKDKQIISDYGIEEDLLSAETILTYYDAAGNVSGTGKMEIDISISNFNLGYVIFQIDEMTSQYWVKENKLLSGRGLTVYDLQDLKENCFLAKCGKFTYSAFNGNEFGEKIYSELFRVLVYDTLEDEEFGVDVNSPLSAEEITQKVGLKDKSGLAISDFSIVSSDYPDSPDLGNYFIKISGFNKENILFYKTILVHVIDMSDFITAPDITTSYKKKLSDAEIKDFVQVSEDYEKKEIETEYNYGWKKVGKYTYTVYVTFLNGVTCYKKGTITVEDKDLPYLLEGKDILYGELDKMLSKEEILKNFWVYDDYDGTISNDDITLDGYLSYVVGYQKEGDFSITLKCTDSSGNNFSYPFVIKSGKKMEVTELLVSAPVPDYKNTKTEINPEEKEYHDPVITTSDYIIETKTSRRLSVSEIQDLLIEEGYLGNLDNVIIESDYFESTEIHPGNYTVSVTELDGDITYYQLLVKQSEEIAEEEESSMLWVWFTVLGISAAAVVIILVMRYVVHAKKN